MIDFITQKVEMRDGIPIEKRPKAKYPLQLHPLIKAVLSIHHPTSNCNNVQKICGAGAYGTVMEHCYLGGALPGPQTRTFLYLCNRQLHNCIVLNLCSRRLHKYGIPHSHLHHIRSQPRLAALERAQAFLPFLPRRFLRIGRKRCRSSGV